MAILFLLLNALLIPVGGAIYDEYRKRHPKPKPPTKTLDEQIAEVWGRGDRGRERYLLAKETYRQFQLSLAPDRDRSVPKKRDKPGSRLTL